MVTQERKPVRLSLFWAGAWAALAFTTAARADFVTPDSIPQPPPAVGSANQTPIPSASDLVMNQYSGRGLLFPFSPDAGRAGVEIGAIYDTAAVTQLAGSNVWAPALSITDGSHIERDLAYPSLLTLQFVRPGGTTSTTVSSVTVDVLHLPNTLPLELIAMDRNGDVVGDITASSGMGPHGGELLTLGAANISSFQLAYEASIEPESREEVPWGVAGIAFTPSPAPEPCGLALAGVGAVALAGWTWRRAWRATLKMTSPAAGL